MVESRDAKRARRQALWGTPLIVVLICVAGRAQAQAPAHPYGRGEPLLPLRLDGHVALNWEGGLGLGARAEFLLMEGTFRYASRDELAISVGGDLTFLDVRGDSAIEGYPTATMQWTLGVDERFAFMTELGLVGRVGESGWRGLYPNFGFGARYYLHRSLGLQGRFGWPLALAAGAVF